MARRSDPERIYQARRAAMLRRLVDNDRVDELDAEHLVAAWEREAEARGLDRSSDAFRDEGGPWIAERRAELRRSG